MFPQETSPNQFTCVCAHLFSYGKACRTRVILNSGNQYYYSKSSKSLRGVSFKIQSQAYLSHTLWVPLHPCGLFHIWAIICHLSQVSQQQQHANLRTYPVGFGIAINSVQINSVFIYWGCRSCHPRKCLGIYLHTKLHQDSLNSAVCLCLFYPDNPSWLLQIGTQWDRWMNGWMDG